MRVAFILPEVALQEAEAHRVCYKLAEELDRHGNSVDVFHLASGFVCPPLARSWRIPCATRIGTHRNPVLWHSFPRGVRLGTIPRFGRPALDHDAVIGVGWEGLEALGLLKISGARFGFVADAAMWEEATPELKARMKAAFCSGPAILCSSLVVERKLREIGVPNLRSLIRPDEMPTSNNDEPGRNREPAICIPFGSVSPNDMDALFETIRMLRDQRGSNIQLWGYGRRTPPARISALLDIFHEAPTDLDLSRLFSNAAVFLLPPRSAGLGIPAVDAMAAGCAVVAADPTGLLHFGRDGENCRIVPADSPKDMVEATIELIDRSALRDKLVTGGLVSMEKLNWEGIGKRLEDALIQSNQERSASSSDPVRKRPASPRPRIVFVHTAGIDLPPERKSGTDIAVASLLREISSEWTTKAVSIPFVHSAIWTRHISAFWESAMPVIVERLAGAPAPDSIIQPGDHIVLADDYAGLLMGRGWRPAAFIRHNAFHDSYAKVPRAGLFQRMIINYHSRLARKFDEWTTRAALGVVAPAGTTENLLRRLSPEGRILPWCPTIPLRASGPFPVRPTEQLRGVIFANFDYAPNLEALAFICHHLAPALATDNIRFRVAGPSAIRRSHGLLIPPNVEIHDFQPDIEAFAAECDFGILPIFQGEGILLKTLTMMSWGMPIVATSKAVAGTGLRDGVNALISDDLPSMVQAIRRLAAPSLRSELGSAAWRTSQGSSDSSGIVDAIARIFRI